MIKGGYHEDLRKASKILREWNRGAVLVFHDDADGLCAGAIASLALEKLGIEHKLVCVEKLSPQIVKLIHSQGNRLYLYVDIGSGRADLIVEELKEVGGLAIIADHHDPIEMKHENLLHLNPELYGYDGESEASGSTATYLLMREAVDIKEAAWIAVVGSAEIPGSLRSLNRIPLMDSIEAGDVELSSRGKSESYRIKFLGKPWRKLSSTLTAIGSMGYYVGGPQEAIRHLKGRSVPEDLASRFENLRKKKFTQAFAIISREGLRVEGRVQWYHLGSLFKGLGSKAVGTFTSMLSYKKNVDPTRYLIGFMDFEPEIPGLGRIAGSWVKLSVRAPRKLLKLIEANEMPAISSLTVEAAKKIGGSGDGHRFAASALIPAGRERDFIGEFNRLIEEHGPQSID